jgi:hypothetical protein
MWTGSYTSLKIIHDQKIAEALKYSCVFTEGQKTQTRALIQIVGMFLARLNPFAVQKPEAATSRGCDWQREGTVS